MMQVIVRYPDTDLPIQLYQHKDDLGVFGHIRECAPCPAIFPMTSDVKTEIDRQWQYYVYACNSGMTLQHVAALFGPQKAFTNRDPGIACADWLREKDLDKPNPWWDKVRTTALSVMTGVEIGTLLKVKTMDGNQPPLLKPGRTYPQRVGEIDPDAYVYHPRTHREMFCVANIVNSDGSVAPFANGAVYDWTGESAPYTFIPYVARFDVYYPLKYLVKLLPGSPLPRPYQGAKL